MKPKFSFSPSFALILTLILILLTGTVALGSQVPFQDGLTITTTADGAWAVYTADVDSDGDLDILSASAYDDKVAWYQNDGGTSPTFTPHVVTTSADGARSVYAADVDSDGDLDILSASCENDQVAWYENDGQSLPIFTSHVITSTADGASSVYAADLDSDGDMDVLSASEEDDKIAWYENDGGAPPTFTSHVITTTTDGARSVYAADLDGDGDFDILSASAQDDKIAWYENDGGAPPTFTSHTIATNADNARAVYAADVDSDGDMDILSASAQDDKIAWYENNGDSPPIFVLNIVTTAADGAHSVHTADIDADGDLDIVSAAWSSGQITWHENDGNSLPGFTDRVVATVNEATWAYAADVDDDGDLDIVSASAYDDKITCYFNQTIHRSAFYPVQAHITIATNAYSAHSVYAADLDSDGDLDVLSASGYDDKIVWYRSDGGAHPSFTHRAITTNAEGAWSVYAADIDSDGDIDVLSASEYDDEIAWYENNGGLLPAFITHSITTNADGARSVYTADVDSDGDLDILTASRFDNRIIWHENDGGSPPAFTEHVIATNANGARSVHAADMDGDGDMDVLSASAVDDKVAWYESDGGSPPSFTPHIISTSANGAHSVHAADMDDDGDLDIVSAAWIGDQVAWYENDGDSLPHFVFHLIATADGAGSAYPADLDQDGDLDILSALANAHQIVWYESNGHSPPAFTSHVITTDINRPISAYAADMDSDGDLDVLSASEYDNKIAWYENRGGQFSLVTTTNTFLEKIGSGRQYDVLRIVATHCGRSGDTDAELATFDLLFEKDQGSTLVTAEANRLIENLHIYRDENGSRSFEVDQDTLVTTIDTLSLTAGVQTVAFGDNESKVQIAFGTPVTYFVVVELTSDAHQQPPYQLRITHLVEPSESLAAGSTVQDRDHDLPLGLGFAPNISSNTCPIVDPATLQPTIYTYLPLVLKKFISYAYVGPCSANNNYCENYDTAQTAYGPIEPGKVYEAFPDDERDYYYFVLPSAKSVTVRVTSYWALGQLIVRDESLAEIGKDVEAPISDGILEVALPNLAPGKYYIQLYTTSGHNQDELYALTVKQ